MAGRRRRVCHRARSSPAAPSSGVRAPAAGRPNLKKGHNALLSSSPAPPPPTQGHSGTTLLGLWGLPAGGGGERAPSPGARASAPARPARFPPKAPIPPPYVRARGLASPRAYTRRAAPRAPLRRQRRGRAHCIGCPPYAAPREGAGTRVVPWGRTPARPHARPPARPFGTCAPAPRSPPPLFPSCPSLPPAFAPPRTSLSLSLSLSQSANSTQPPRPHRRAYARPAATPTRRRCAAARKDAHQRRRRRKKRDPPRSQRAPPPTPHNETSSGSAALPAKRGRPTCARRPVDGKQERAGIPFAEQCEEGLNYSPTPLGPVPPRLTVPLAASTPPCCATAA